MYTSDIDENNLRQRLCDISAAGKTLNLSRTSIYSLLNDGSLSSVKIGKRRLIPVESIDAFISNLARA